MQSIVDGLGVRGGQDQLGKLVLQAETAAARRGVPVLADLYSLEIILENRFIPAHSNRHLKYVEYFKVLLIMESLCLTMHCNFS